MLAIFLSFLSANFSLFDRTVQSAVWVHAGREGRGTGIVVSVRQKHIVTNYHVVGEATNVNLYFPHFENGRLTAQRDDYVRDSTARLVRGRVILRDGKRDLALIEAERLPTSARAIEFADAPTKAGENASLIGNRFDFPTLWNSASGSVRQVFRSREGVPWRTETLAKKCRLIALDIPIAEGDSGGPVVNAQGKLIGVTSSIRHLGQQTALAVEVSEVRRFLELPEMPPAKKPQPPSIVESITRATVIVQSWASSSRATGVVIDRERRLVLTTHSAVGSRDRVFVTIPKWKDGTLASDVSDYDDNDRTMAVVLARDRRRNLALVELARKSHDASSLIISVNEARPGDQLHCLGNPNGHEALWLYASAQVRQISRAHLSSSKEDEDVRVLLLQSTPTGLDSGGPITDLEGRLVGLSSGKNGTGLNVVFAIAVTEIREFLLTARWATNPTSVADHVKRSERFAKVQWWEETLLEMTRALIVEPRSGVAIQRTVEYLVLAGQFGAARKSAERSLEIIPANESSAIHAAIARCLLNDGKTDQALAAADAAIRHDPKNTSALLARAACFLSAEKLAESLKILNDAISLQPNTAEGYFLRSTVYMKKRQFQQALDDASRAIELDPYNPDFLIHRSKIHLTHEDRLMAEADRNAAERLDRENRAR